MLNITLDFETCSLCPTAAVMSFGAVAWKRGSEKSSFYKLSSGALDTSSVFSCHIDLRSMFGNNFTFDNPLQSVAFEHELVRNIQIAVQIESGLAVMKVSAGLAAVEEVERTGRRDVQPFGQLVRHTAYLMAKNHLLNSRRLDSFFKFFLIHRSAGIGQ